MLNPLVSHLFLLGTMLWFLLPPPNASSFHWAPGTRSGTKGPEPVAEATGLGSCPIWALLVPTFIAPLIEQRAVFAGVPIRRGFFFTQGTYLSAPVSVSSVSGE